MLLITFRSKHFFFWLVVLAAIMFSRLAYNKISADIANQTDSFDTDTVFTRQLTIEPNGKATLGNQDVSWSLKPGARGEKNDTFYYKILDNQGTSYSHLRLEIFLPSSTPASDVKVEPILTYTNVPTATVVKNDNQISITGIDVGPQALFSLRLFLPKGAIHFPLYRSFIGFLINENLALWSILSIIVALFSVAAILIIIWRQRKIRQNLRTKDAISRPPDNLEPAVLNILYSNRVTAKATTAFLLNMANRGLIEVVFKNGEFTFGRLGLFSQQARQKLELTSAQKVILSKIFSRENYKAKEKEVRFRLSHRVFSQKVALFYALLYQEADRRELFISNPAGVHRHYHLLGLSIFYFGLFGFLISMIFSLLNIALLWLGMVVAGAIFIRFSSQISFLSSKGIQELSQWLAFRNFLTMDSPLAPNNASRQIFLEFLPYAVAMGCEKEWIARFNNQAFSPPEWYISLDEDTNWGSFSLRLLGLLDWLARSLAYIKDPAVD